MSRGEKTRKRNILLSLFPTPSFLSMPSIGMSFSDTHVRFVEFTNKRIGKVPELGDHATIELPQGVIVNGEIVNPEKLIELILSVQKDFDFMYVRAALPEQKGYLYKTEVPYLEEGDIRDSVGFSLEENAPISVNDAIFDFDVIALDKKKKKVEVVVTVFPQKVIEAYADVLERSGLTPLAFELEAHAVARAVVKRGDQNAYIVVDHMVDKVGLYIVSGEVVQFTTTIHLGKESITGIGGAFSLQSKNDDPSVGLLKNEISKLEGYWKTHGGSIAAVVLVGVGVEDVTYQQALSSVVDLPVETANVWQNVFSFKEYIPDIPAQESLVYASAIGLALPDHS